MTVSRVVALAEEMHGHLKGIPLGERESREQQLVERMRASVAPYLDGSNAEADNGAAQRSTWKPVDLAAVLGSDAEEEKPSVLAREDGACLLYRGRLNTLFAPPEQLKSWLALGAARQELLAGNDVVYIDFEDSARGVVERLRDLGVEDQLIVDKFVYIQPAESVEAGRPELEAALARNPTLVVIDGVTESMTLEGLSLNDNAEVAEFFARLPRWMAHRPDGPAVLMLDHVVKSREGRGNYALGAQSKLAGIDGAAYTVTMTMPFGRGRIGHGNLCLTKDRLGWIDAEGKIRLVANIEAESYEGAVAIRLTAPVPTDEFRPTVLMERVSIALENRMSEGANWSWIQKNVKGKGEWKHQALDVLVREGFVTIESGNHNAHVHHSVRPYREAEESREQDAGR